MSTPYRFVLALPLAIAFALTIAPAAVANSAIASDTSDFTFDSLDADYTLSREGDGTSTLAVTETIVARFPDFDQNRGIVRAIPDDYDGVALNTVVHSVTDENGAPVAFDTVASGGFVELALGTDDFVRGVQTYVISYTQHNVVRSFADTKSDEFYWDVNGTGWAQPFGRVAAAVHLGPQLASLLTGNAACYVGSFGETAQCPIDRAPDETNGGATFNATSDDLAPGQTLTVSIGFASNTFLTPEPTAPPAIAPPTPITPWMQLASGAVGLASIGSLIAAIVWRVRAGRGARSPGPIIAQYDEPAGIDIVQSAWLVSRGSSAIPSAIVRLAVRKNLRILAYAVDADGPPFTLQYLTDDRAEALDLSLLTALFGAVRKPGDLKPYGAYESALADRLEDLSRSAQRSLETEGFKRSPGGMGFALLMALAQFVLIFVGAGLTVVSVFLFGDVSPVTILSTVAAFFSVFIAVGLAFRPMQLTEKGRQTTDFLEGMRLYLTVAEEERLRMLQSPSGAERIDVGNNFELVKLYEKLLPWAVLWGVEREWMRELEVRVASLDETPDWFVGRAGFEIATFTTAVRGMNATMTAPPSSSGWSGSGGGSSFSGGSFGGGFSGGGGGGGGGGGR